MSLPGSAQQWLYLVLLDFTLPLPPHPPWLYLVLLDPIRLFPTLHVQDSVVNEAVRTVYLYIKL